MWKKLVYVRKGTSHERNQTECQDSAIVRESGSCVIAALSDGIGSLQYSEVAAQTTTRTVCDIFERLDGDLGQFKNEQDLAGYVLNEVIKNLNDVSIKERIPLSEMDCTLVFVCVLKHQNRAILGRLGDSAICLVSEAGSTVINDGNKSANGTHAVLEKDALDNFEITVYDIASSKIQGFILSSDGLENEIYMKGSKRISKSAELYINALNSSEDASKLVAERIDKLTSVENSPFDDDISIIILSQAERDIVLPEDPTWLCKCGYRNDLQTTYCLNCGNDFSLLYQNIKFREYGGKAAFFNKINKNRNEELKLLGLPVENTDDALQPDALSQANEPETAAFASINGMPVEKQTLVADTDSSNYSATSNPVDMSAHKTSRAYPEKIEPKAIKPANANALVNISKTQKSTSKVAIILFITIGILAGAIAGVLIVHFSNGHKDDKTNIEGILEPSEEIFPTDAPVEPTDDPLAPTDEPVLPTEVPSGPEHTLTPEITGEPNPELSAIATPAVTGAPGSPGTEPGQVLPNSPGIGMGGDGDDPIEIPDDSLMSFYTINNPDAILYEHPDENSDSLYKFETSEMTKKLVNVDIPEEELEAYPEHDGWIYVMAPGDLRGWMKESDLTKQSK